MFFTVSDRSPFVSFYTSLTVHLKSHGEPVDHSDMRDRNHSLGLKLQSKIESRTHTPRGSRSHPREDRRNCGVRHGHHVSLSPDATAKRRAHRPLDHGGAPNRWARRSAGRAARTRSLSRNGRPVVHRGRHHTYPQGRELTEKRVALLRLTF